MYFGQTDVILLSFPIHLTIVTMNKTSHQQAKRTVLFSVFGNAILALAKGIAGVFGNSYALIADAIESATDVLSSILVLLGLRYATKPADDNHPYGHGRIEPLITFVVVAFMVTSAVVIAIEAVRHFYKPQTAPEPWTLIVLGIIILWKELSYRYVIRNSRRTHSTALKAEAWHHRSDAITSVAAAIGIGMALLLGEGYEFLDDLAALFASVFILYNSYLIFRPAFGEFMDENLHDDLIARIRQTADEVDGIVETEKCFVRKTGMTYHVDLHAVVDGSISVRKGHELAHDLKDKLLETIPNLGQILIHIEPDS